MKRPWFVVKRYGFGLSPNGLGGWTTLVAYVLALAAAPQLAVDRGWSQVRTGGVVLALTVLVVAVMLLTSDRKPWRWRWGERDEG